MISKQPINLIYCTCSIFCAIRTTKMIVLVKYLCRYLATLLIKCHGTFDVSNYYDSPSQASLSMVASIRAVWASLTSRLLGLNRRWVVATSSGLLNMKKMVIVQNVQSGHLPR